MCCWLKLNRIMKTATRNWRIAKSMKISRWLILPQNIIYFYPCKLFNAAGTAIFSRVFLYLAAVRARISVWLQVICEKMTVREKLDNKEAKITFWMRLAIVAEQLKWAKINSGVYLTKANYTSQETRRKQC